MSDAVMSKLLKLARWTLERWLDGESWQKGGPALTAGEDGPVDGLFVTLREGRKLRGCIGTVERQDSLDAALRRLTVSAAAEDPRFPPVSRDELPRLSISLSLLTPPERLGDPEQIVVGRDGLIIEHQGRRGLLLPEVPTEYGWDRIRFLEELCRKAFLPPAAWQDPRTRLFRFESRRVSEGAE
jgi:AmmeMemoRadiSam system protein A